ncbi:serine/threonine-protein kinase [Streptomyces sp. NPDC049881]|uniref:serine/threonine-protein kinase n=1 Tax=Streptomyces sp. NPDC049881 TaxID=3155778 RepID=UPI003449401C
MEPLRGEDPATVGPFALLGRLGAGGMGRVYLARSPGGVLTAVKVIREDIAERPDSLARFRREVDLLGTVRSPYTAHLVDAGLDAAPYWLATEYVPGPTLLAASRGRPLPPDICAAVLAALAEALAAVHRVGVVHRDVKPHNVILASGGPRLIDFGIAWAADLTPLTDTGHTPGTPGYAAPEAMTGGRAGPAADVFALGATVAAAATGRPPFGTGEWAAVGYRVVHGEIDVDGVPAPLADLIRDCTAKDPAERPSPGEIVRRCAVDRPLALLPAYREAVAAAPAPDVPPDVPSSVPVPGTVPHDAPPLTARTVPQDAPPAVTVTPPTPTPPPAAPARRRRWLRPVLLPVLMASAIFAAANFVIPRLTAPDTDPGGQAGGATPTVSTEPTDPAAELPSDSLMGDLDWLASDHTCEPTADALSGLSTSVAYTRGTTSAEIGWRMNDGFVPGDSPYPVLVAVRAPGSAAPVMSAPLDLAADPAAGHELTYPGDFPGATALADTPGDWTVVFLHAGTGGISTIGCNGFTAP